MVKKIFSYHFLIHFLTISARQRTKKIFSRLRREIHQNPKTKYHNNTLWTKTNITTKRNRSARHACTASMKWTSVTLCASRTATPLPSVRNGRPGTAITTWKDNFLISRKQTNNKSLNAQNNQIKHVIYILANFIACMPFCFLVLFLAAFHSFNVDGRTSSHVETLKYWCFGTFPHWYIATLQSIWDASKQATNKRRKKESLQGDNK